jgi:hypothetical protein
MWAHLGKINNEFGYRRNPFDGRGTNFTPELILTAITEILLPLQQRQSYYSRLGRRLRQFNRN